MTSLVTSKVGAQNYVAVMRSSTQKILDHMSRTRREPSYFRHRSLLRGYYRHVLSDIRRAKPGCREDAR
jgi:hypothetical protein